MGSGARDRAKGQQWRQWELPGGNSSTERPYEALGRCQPPAWPGMAPRAVRQHNETQRSSSPEIFKFINDIRVRI